MKLIMGDLEPTGGRVKRGKTVRVATLSQHLAELADHDHLRVRELLQTKRTEYLVGGREVTPSQLLEQLGFGNELMSTPIKDLSGGQRRRLQLLMILLDEPNVLVLDEPTNDLDTDMLAAMEDLLDSWPGTLLVATHDRYLLERVTDQQYAIIDRTLRHLPGGVDQYLQLASEGQPAAVGEPRSEAPAKKTSAARSRAVGKEITSIERRLERLASDVARLEELLAGQISSDAADYLKLAEHGRELDRLREETDTLENRWLELSTDDG
jgi:ABC-type multidrug transport system ATPase subunit